MAQIFNSYRRLGSALLLSTLFHILIVALSGGRTDSGHLARLDAALFVDLGKPVNRADTVAHPRPESESFRKSKTHRKDQNSASNLSSDKQNSNIQDENPRTTKPQLTYIDEFDLSEIDEYFEGGYLELEVVVTLDGKPAKITTTASSLPEKFFQVAHEAFAAASFAPATLGGTSVSGIYRVRVFFPPSEAPEEAVERQGKTSTQKPGRSSYPE